MMINKAVIRASVIPDLYSCKYYLTLLYDKVDVLKYEKIIDAVINRLKQYYNIKFTFIEKLEAMLSLNEFLIGINKIDNYDNVIIKVIIDKLDTDTKILSDLRDHTNSDNEKVWLDSCIVDLIELIEDLKRRLK